MDFLGLVRTVTLISSSIYIAFFLKSGFFDFRYSSAFRAFHSHGCLLLIIILATAAMFIQPFHYVLLQPQKLS
jgi:hypothetical protein